MSKEEENKVKCFNCGLNIVDHVRITFVSCLAALSGEIEVYRNVTKKSKGKYND